MRYHNQMRPIPLNSSLGPWQPRHLTHHSRDRGSGAASQGNLCPFDLLDAPSDDETSPSPRFLCSCRSKRQPSELTISEMWHFPLLCSHVSRS